MSRVQPTPAGTSQSCGQRRPISGPGEDRDTIQGYRDRDTPWGDDVLDSGSDIVCGLCIQCLSLFRVTLSGALSLSPRPGPPSRDGRMWGEYDIFMSLSLPGPLIGHSDRPSDWLAPVWPRGPCHIQLQDIVMQLSALYKEGGKIAICINCKMSSSGGDKLWPEPGPGWLVSGRSDISWSLTPI